MTTKFKEELKNNITYKLQAINNQFLEFKSRMIYVQLDLIKMLKPKTMPTHEQLKSIIQSFQTHANVEMSLQNVQSYVQNLFNDL